MSALENRDNVLSKVIQIQASKHHLFALDESGKIWILNKHICMNNNFDLSETEDSDKVWWIPVSAKPKDA